MTNKHPSLFSPFMLTEKIKLRNRIVMAPMTTWSANPDGTISEQELEFYKRRVPYALQMLGIFVAIGIISGVGGSMITMRKYLNKEGSEISAV